MGCEEEDQEQEGSTSAVLKLPLLPMKSHTLTPSLLSPIHPTLASVPFSWEEEPGKPKPNSSSPPPPPPEDQTNNSLELPPRLVFLERDAKTASKQTSPSTVLDGPYSMGRSRRFESPSFRKTVMGSGDCYGSFRSYIYGDMEEVVEEECHQQKQGQQQSSGPLDVAKKRRSVGGYRGRVGFVGLWRKRALKGKIEFGGGSYVFPSSVDRESDGDSTSSFNKTEITGIGRTGSFASIPSSKSHFWVSLSLSLC